MVKWKTILFIKVVAVTRNFIQKLLAFLLIFRANCGNINLIAVTECFAHGLFALGGALLFLAAANIYPERG